MASSSSKRSCCTKCLSFLLRWLNLLLFISSLASIAIIFILKNPPSHFGIVLLSASCLALFSSLLGFCSQHNKCCCATHLIILLFSAIFEAFSFASLYYKEPANIPLLKSARDPKEVKLLVRVDTVLFLVMLLLQVMVMIFGFVWRRCLIADYQELEIRRDEIAMKRKMKIAQVQDEAMAANAAKMEEGRANNSSRLEEKMKTKYDVTEY